MIDTTVLYEVIAPDFETVATCLVIRSGPGYGWVGFHDTRRGNMMDGTMIEETARGFIWEWSQQDASEDYALRPAGKVVFQAMTLDQFEDKWRVKLSGGKKLPRFKDEQELWSYFAEQYDKAGYPY